MSLCQLRKQFSWQVFSGFILALGITSPSFGAAIDEISDKLRQGDFSVVQTQLIPLAEAGDARAQYNLGVSYRFGNGVEQNIQKAFYWTQKSAQNGNLKAEVNLASMFMDGQAVPKDVASAISWYQRASTQGDINADLALAKIYRNGLAGKVDYAKAFEYYSMAANEGSEDARYNLAAFYHYGLGVTKNEDKAQALFASLKTSSAGNLPSYTTSAGEQATGSN